MKIDISISKKVSISVSHTYPQLQYGVINKDIININGSAG